MQTNKNKRLFLCGFAIIYLDMRYFLLSGVEHQYVGDYIGKKRHTLVNKNALTLGEITEHLQENVISCDRVIVTDSALSADNDVNMRVLDYLSGFYPDIIVITRDYLFEASNKSVTVIVSQWFRASHDDLDKAFVVLNEPSNKENVTEKKRKWGIKSKKTDSLDDSLDDVKLDRTSSRVIVFTGHRGSGVTSTAFNVALSAVSRNLNTMFVDLDTDYRTANLYSGEFNRLADEDEIISSSLVRLLAQPHKYETMAVNSDGLWLTSLGYDFDEERLLEQHFTESKLIGLVSSLKYNFDLIVVDFPLDALARFPSLLNNTDLLALCMENNLYSAFSTVRNISIGYENRSDISYFASKARLIATKYNDESVYDGEPITPERLSELIVNEGFCEDFTTQMPIAGSVPYEKHFDRQIESDISIIFTDNRMKQAYDRVLLNLLGAVR